MIYTLQEVKNKLRVWVPCGHIIISSESLGLAQFFISSKDYVGDLSELGIVVICFLFLLHMLKRIGQKMAGWFHTHHTTAVQSFKHTFLERSAVHVTPGKISLMHFKLPRVVLNWLAASFFLVTVSSDHQSMMWDSAFVLVHIHLHTQRHMVCFLEVIFIDVGI